MHVAVLLAAESVKAKNPIVPETKEIVWAVISFAIVFGLLAWKAWPAIKKAIADREAHIRTDLERAESAKTEAETSRADYQQQLSEARNEAGKIIEEARLAADQVRKDLIARAETEAAELRGRAQDLEVVTAHHLTQGDPRLAGSLHTQCDVVERGEAVHRTRPRVQVAILRVRE